MSVMSCDDTMYLRKSYILTVQISILNALWGKGTIKEIINEWKPRGNKIYASIVKVARGLWRQLVAVTALPKRIMTALFERF